MEMTPINPLKLTLSENYRLQKYGESTLNYIIQEDLSLTFEGFFNIFNLYKMANVWNLTII